MEYKNKVINRISQLNNRNKLISEKDNCYKDFQKKYVTYIYVLCTKGKNVYLPLIYHQCATLLTAFKRETSVKFSVGLCPMPKNKNLNPPLTYSMTFFRRIDRGPNTHVPNSLKSQAVYTVNFRS